MSETLGTCRYVKDPHLFSPEQCADWSPAPTIESRLADALRELLRVCPQSGDLALLIRAIQVGGEEGERNADRTIEFYSGLDEAQDEARAVLAEHDRERGAK